ncbi:6-phosphogluconolactonase [Pseudooceanicola batsensis HTCC2597]|uniref:6-phosphogluconolactonase n=1 Tax=Pseudooceanicola batsensis (strain ATCC BAA-863 / DSM 15984 / KCTC 12145 / HTCC2597) TaxID=252305 RepID=A3TXI3_PSEBH|nr:6-phosphogluconolactonase [Pseudooceanicola batsensis]EAQ03543.1 6-phosphogluconolactonase [Pseudooceanicola batsensis HTCC2597]
MNLVEYPDRDLLALDLAEVLADALNQSLRQKDRATFAVPGGTSPGPVFQALSQVHLPWDRVDVMLTDERWVPESSDRSNTALLRRSLLTGPAAAATLIPLYDAAPAPEDRLETLIAGVAPLLPIDVMLIGMGADMHTASLFPGADRLTEGLSGDAPLLLPMRAPGAPEPRVTLTAPVLSGALDIHLLIMGTEKKEALLRASQLPPAEAPVACLLEGATIHYAD